jgi:hypothetical protein
MMLAYKRRPRRFLPLFLGVAVLTSLDKTLADDAVIRNDRYALSGSAILSRPLAI